ncbi:allantoinase [Paenibacillus psychroresistens]|uniref:Allantoinase n=1 Tax=Paenibacillus psychroresistens TaxID=1778678 RepID=A0A6B8RLE8_9BACL|nr:allantoinase [Paenibacillus psychroresistens]QGQ97140.1 allantoinase [Paenibacillus psychroresistens]
MTKKLDLVIRQGFVVLKDEVRLLDIGVSEGKIVSLAESIECEDCREIDAAGLYVLPGMVDVHVHFNEPGLGSWEGFASGSASLAAGGCTTYVDMPLNGVPPTVNAAAFKQKLAAAESNSYVDYAFWGGLQIGNLDELETLAECGIVGFKAFMSSPGGDGEDIFREVDDLTLYEGMRKIAAIGGILALHAESEPIVSQLALKSITEGRLTAKDFIESRPILAELEAVNRALFYAEETGCKLHFVHISSPQAVALIQQAKLIGLDVTLETCPHYLTLLAEDMESLGAIAKCAPPLRGQAEQDALWMLVRNGHIDMISSDHSPCPTSMKSVDNANFFEAWGGISGAQSSMELMLHEGYHRRAIPLPLISRMLSLEPAKRFGLHPRKGEIALMADADLVMVDLNASYILQKTDLLYKHKHSPYLGKTLDCRVVQTWNRGKLVYQLGQGHGIQEPAAGAWLGKN